MAAGRPAVAQGTSRHSAVHAKSTACRKFHEERGEVDLQCADTGRVLRDASQGTVWADIVTEGRVLAGDGEILKEIEVQPVNPDTVGETMANIRVAIVRGLQATVPSGPNEEVHGRNARMREGSRASADAAEMATRIMMVLAGVQPSGGHLVTRHAEILERHSATQDTETARELVRAMVRLAGRMNGGTQRAHNALYHGQADPEKTLEGARVPRDGDAFRAHRGVARGRGAARGAETACTEASAHRDDGPSGARREGDAERVLEETRRRRG